MGGFESKNQIDFLFSYTQRGGNVKVKEGEEKLAITLNQLRVFFSVI
jgi:hypothetical protein